jgi:hypothetical protein
MSVAIDEQPGEADDPLAGTSLTPRTSDGAVRHEIGGMIKRPENPPVYGPASFPASPEGRERPKPEARVDPDGRARSATPPTTAISALPN